MIYRLLTNIEVVPPPKYKKMLGINRAPQGIKFNLKFSVRNISKEDFPGAVVESVSAIGGSSEYSGIRTYLEMKQELGPIKINESKNFYNWNVLLTMPGLYWIECNMKPEISKEDKLEFVQTKSGSNPTDVFREALFAIEREKLEQLKQLEMINKKLDKLISKGK